MEFTSSDADAERYSSQDDGHWRYDCQHQNPFIGPNGRHPATLVRGAHPTTAQGADAIWGKGGKWLRMIEINAWQPQVVLVTSGNEKQ